MKKRIVSLCLALVLALSLAGIALAVDETTVTPVGNNVTAQLEGNKIKLTVSGLTSGQQYLVLMVSELYTEVSQVKITESTIRYIDQKADTNGTVSFDVYPDSLQTSTILLSSGSGLQIVATVEVPYKRGDADLNGRINMADAAKVARHFAGRDKLVGNALLAADADNNGRVNMADAAKIARVFAGRDTIN